MHKENVLEEIKNLVKKEDYFSPKDRENICLLSSHILDIDFFSVPKCIDKKEIYTTLMEVLKETKLDLSVVLNGGLIERYLRLQMRRRRELFGNELLTSLNLFPLTVWGVIWEVIWGKGYNLSFVNLDAYTCQRAYYRVLNYIWNYFEEKIKTNFQKQNGQLPPTALLSSLRDYISLTIWFYIVLNFKGVNNLRIREYLPAMKKLLNLSKQGQGLLLIGGGGGRSIPRLEIRIPVYNEENYPQIIDCEAAPYLEVSLLKEGIFVPEKVWRNPEKLTPQDLIKETNLEVRRIMLNTMGNKKFFRLSNARLLHRYADYQLYRVVVANLPAIHILCCVCPSTGREYFLRVPPTINDALEAVAWTFAETKESYKLLAEA